MRFLLLVVLTGTSWAQLRTKVDINGETPEGLALQQIGQEQDPNKKLPLLEAFIGKYPKNPNMPWVLGTAIPIYQNANQPDKVMASVEQLLALDPTDAEMAHAALKTAEAKNDGELIVKWALATSQAAKKAGALPKPTDEDEVERWTYRVNNGKQVDKYAEYAVYAAALRATDPGMRVKLMDSVVQVNPQSEYLAPLDDYYFDAYRRMNNNEKALEVAERSVAANKAGEDMLLFAANAAFDKKDPAKAATYAQKLIDLMKTKPAPQGVESAAWESKRKTVTGAGLWLIGMTHAGAMKWQQVDDVLREALPMLEGNDALLGPALFQLGLANFRMGEKGAKGQPDTKRIMDALRFNQQCAAIKGPYQAPAQRNIGAIRAQYRIPAAAK